MKKIYHRFLKWYNHPKLDKIKFYIEEYNKHSIGDSAAAMSYYMIFALVPLLVFMLIWLSFISSRVNFIANMNFSLSNLMPPPVAEYLTPIIKGVLYNNNSYFLSLGLISLLWASSRGFDYFIAKLQNIYNVKETTYIVRRLIGIVFIALMAISIFFLLIFMAFSNKIVDFLHLISPEIFKAFIPISLISFIVPLLFLFFELTFVYYFASARKGRFAYSLIAALFPTGTWYLLSFSMRFYVNQFSKFDILYGGLTGIIIVIFWLYILFFAVFLGAFIQEQVFLKFKKVQNSERKKNESL